MKTISSLLIFLLAINLTWGGEYTFQVKEYNQPHVLKLTTNDDNSEIENFELSSDGKILFKLEGSNNFQKSTEELYLNDESLEGESNVAFEDIVAGLTPIDELTANPWGDAPIVKAHTYSIFLRLDITDNKVVSGRLEIADHEYEEMALWGDLVPQE